MRSFGLASVLVVVALSLGGCMGSEADLASAQGEARGGCRVICPRCRPNQPCPRIACYEVCRGNAPEREQCGDTLCAAGDVCCNASCGICAPPDGFCTQQVCEPTTLSECASDADCTTFSNYCDGCSCEALAAGEAEPICAGTTVACFADPCMSSEARCVSGSCQLVSTSTL